MRFFKSTALALTLGIASAVSVSPSVSLAQVAVGVGISVGFAPPPLPIYAQPPIPGPGYMWTPGYWAWDEGIGDYYWVPGAWVLSPEVGLLWTPAWWGWNDGVYLFHAGYWGPQVGFYGGIAYGFGYDGIGYAGGYWNGGQFFYNRAVNNVTNVNVTNVFTRPVSANRTTVSFNGGPGGVQARATQQQLAAANARHVGPTSQQLQQTRLAAQDPALRASRNKGAPPIAATQRAGAFHDPHVVPASRPGGSWRAPTEAARRAEATAPAAGRTGAEAARSSGTMAAGRQETRTPTARSAESAGAASAFSGPEHHRQHDYSQGGYSRGGQGGGPGAGYERSYEHRAPRAEGSLGGPSGYERGGPSGYERHAPPMEERRSAGAYGPGPNGERSRSEPPMASRPPREAAPHEARPAFQPGPERQGPPPEERRQRPGE
jgi:hypothetical protein